MNTTSYNRELICDDLQSLKIKRDGEGIQTFYKGILINESKLSDRYGVFPFGDFVIDMLPQIEKQFTPIEMSVGIWEGIQDVRFMSKKFKIMDDVFQFVLSIFSSSDGSRKLAMRGGLLRQVCTNGMMGLTDDATFVSCKHFKFIVEEKTQEFVEGIQRIKNSNNQAIKILQELPGKQVDLPDFARKFCYEKVENKNVLLPERFVDLKQLANKLIMSETDALDLSILKQGQKDLLFQPKKLIEKTGIEFPIDRYQLFNNYIEIHRNQTPDVIAKHTKLILDKIYDCKN